MKQNQAIIILLNLNVKSMHEYINELRVSNRPGRAAQRRGVRPMAQPGPGH